MNQSFLSQVLQIGTGAAFILFPLIFVFAFSVHPRLLRPRLLKPEELIRRARRNKLLQLAHSLVLLSTALLIVMALHFMKILSQGNAAWTGLIGAGLAVLGAILLATDKGALCLTMSALDTVPEEKFSAMMPGLLAMFSKKGWMILLWGILLLPAGFAIQAVGLLQVMPRDGIAADFECANGPCFASRPTIAELLDPAYNLEYGTRMLAGLINRLGSAELDRWRGAASKAPFLFVAYFNCPFARS